jgi:hypothetical protein
MGWEGRQFKIITDYSCLWPLSHISDLRYFDRSDVHAVAAKTRVICVSHRSSTLALK